jgi:hypothetical protein
VHIGPRLSLIADHEPCDRRAGSGMLLCAASDQTSRYQQMSIQVLPQIWHLIISLRHSDAWSTGEWTDLACCTTGLCAFSIVELLHTTHGELKQAASDSQRGAAVHQAGTCSRDSGCYACGSGRQWRKRAEAVMSLKPENIQHMYSEMETRWKTIQVCTLLPIWAYCANMR